MDNSNLYKKVCLNFKLMKINWAVTLPKKLYLVDKEFDPKLTEYQTLLAKWAYELILFDLWILQHKKTMHTGNKFHQECMFSS